MAKDDFFVIAFRILVYLYGCAKTATRPNLRQLKDATPCLDALNESYWQFVIKNLGDAGYISGVKVGVVVGSTEQLDTRDVSITIKGIEYLQENSTMQKVGKALKQAGEIVPGLIEAALEFLKNIV